jgi:murein DD-endopeptidase MepM/ murein hydrolase activator NlpD
VAVKENESAAQGQVLGALGNTGRSTGPHLGYQIIFDGSPLDPAELIDATLAVTSSLEVQQ